MTAPALGPMASIAAQIQEKLRALDPERLELMDESGQHVGHAGAAGGGGHYRLTIVSPRFSGVGRLARHRLVYAALGDLMKQHIHALAIEAYSPDEL
jgi:BolA family transcriptional regulator, general stress-responsive regulator